MFFSKNRNLKKYVDNIFPITEAFKNDQNENKINGTIGSFYNDDGKIVAFNSVYDAFRKLKNETYASYASSSFGNKDFNEAISKYVLENKINSFRIIPTPGGTGAINLGINLCLEKNDTIIIPDIAWGNYKNIALEYDLNVLTYDVYDLNDLLEKINEVSKAFVIINSPCQNPLGHSYSYDQWQEIINYINKQNKEIIILNDVAYIEFANDINYKNYFSLFNQINNNVLVLIAYSCSKTFSYYGMRLGALFMIHNDEEFLELFNNQAARRARATYSSVNNGAMKAIVELINNDLDNFLNEKDYYKKILKERVEAFIDECKKHHIPFYKYNDGFFVTLRFDDNRIRDLVFDKFIENHLYFIKVNKGIRVGLCGIPVNKIKGLGQQISNIIAKVI